MSTLSWRDRARRWSYLQDLDLWLFNASGRERRQILRDVKDKLAEAAPEIGMRRAVEELGRPRELARQYLDADPRPGPVWAHGALAAVLAFVAVLTSFALYTAGMLAALESTGVARAEGSFLGVAVAVGNDPVSLGATFSGISWPWVAVVALAWALGSRIWRLARRSPAPSTSDLTADPAA